MDIYSAKKKRLRHEIQRLRAHIEAIENCATDPATEALSRERVKDDGVAGTIVWLIEERRKFEARREAMK